MLTWDCPVNWFLMNLFRRAGTKLEAFSDLVFVKSETSKFCLYIYKLQIK
jgi:hypothetical protein